MEERRRYFRLDDEVILDFEPVSQDEVRRWKERKERKRHWFSPNKAARLVNEEELTGLLKRLAEDSGKLTALEELRRAS